MIHKYGIDGSRAVVNKGDSARLRRVMQKAMRGERITVGFLGGSITQGCLSSVPETCYAYLVYRWWCEKFPDANVNYVNAGIGGTTSQFGVARVEDDLLSCNIDFTVVEFSVNDENTSHFLETYEGLIRRICYSATEPAVLIVHSVRYDDGGSAEEQHVKVGRQYGIPCVSMKPTLYGKILDGTYTSRDITEDDLHPNDEGHMLMAGMITDFLDSVYEELQSGDGKQCVNALQTDSCDVFGDADKTTLLSQNSYENSVRYRNNNCGTVLVSNDGFAADDQPQNDIREIFRLGWTAANKGAWICFEVEGTCIGVQYRKSVAHPACVAAAVIDGDAANAIVLDGNFEETWGDSLHLDTLAEHLPYGRHRVEITITDACEGAVPFYLVSVIASGSDGKNRKILETECEYAERNLAERYP